VWDRDKESDQFSCVQVGHAQMNIPDLIEGFITWQSTLPCRANQETPFVDEWVFQNRGVCGQAFPFLPSPPPSRTFLRSPQVSLVRGAKRCLERAGKPMEALATQANKLLALMLCVTQNLIKK